MSARAHLYWSLRRELWENRSIYVAPLAVAALALLGFLIKAGDVPDRVRAVSALDPEQQTNLAVVPYGIAASVILFTSIVVGVFYCLDALYGERRDRSILFWKSMPVSDLTTLGAKAIVVLAVVPVLAWAVAVATQLAMLSSGTVVLLANGLDPSALWAPLPLAQIWLAMLYGMAVHALWFAPIYGWLLLVSAWARRAPFLWAVLPILGAYAVETVAFGTRHVVAMLMHRLLGAMPLAFGVDAMEHPITRLSQLEPLRFLGAPGLWIGLLFAFAFIAIAVRLRRYREPI